MPPKKTKASTENSQKPSVNAKVTESVGQTKQRILQLVTDIITVKSEIKRNRDCANLTLNILSWASFALSLAVAAVVGYSPLATFVWTWIPATLAGLSGLIASILKFGNFGEKSAHLSKQFVEVEDIVHCAQNELGAANTKGDMLRVFSEIRTRYHKFRIREFNSEVQHTAGLPSNTTFQKPKTKFIPLNRGFSAPC